MKKVNYMEKFEQFGFFFDDGILGGSEGAGYYDVESDKISGFKLDGFNESEFDKWYDNFNVDSFNKWECDVDENEDIDGDGLLSELEPGMYWISEGAMNEGYIKIEEGRMVTVFACPILINDDDLNNSKVMFSFNENGTVKEEMSKEEVKALLMENINKPGTWMIM